MTTHIIEIEGYPTGWKAVAYRQPREGESFIASDGKLIENCCPPFPPRLIVEKIKPYRIVLEETGEINQKDKIKGIYCMQYFSHDICLFNQPQIWREIKLIAPCVNNYILLRAEGD